MNDHSHSAKRASPTQKAALEQLSEQEFWDYAQSLAIQRNTALPADEEALECWTEQGCYLLSLRTLREVVAPPHRLTLLPLSPPWMSGITAWRGHVIPVVDLTSYVIAHKTHELDTTYTAQHVSPLSHSMLVILDDANVLLGVQVEVIGSVITLEQVQLASPEQAPAWYPRSLLPMLRGVYDGAALLDSQLLITEMVQEIKVGG